ncbi:DUF6379 domain-containing protein [Paenarthrobacter ureafaciens]
MPNGLIQEDSLRAHPQGLAVSLTLPWYRSLWLSSVSTLELSVDGEKVPQEDLTLELGGKAYSLAELPAQSEVLWFLQEHPLLVVRRPGQGGRGGAAHRAHPWRTAAALHADCTRPGRRSRQVCA